MLLDFSWVGALLLSHLANFLGYLRQFHRDFFEPVDLLLKQVHVNVEAALGVRDRHKRGDEDGQRRQRKRPSCDSVHTPVFSTFPADAQTPRFVLFAERIETSRGGQHLVWNDVTMMIENTNAPTARKESK